MDFPFEFSLFGFSPAQTTFALLSIVAVIALVIRYLYLPKSRLAAARVAAGVRWLDGVASLESWRDSIDLGVLDMGSSFTCICGQLERRYHLSLGGTYWGFLDRHGLSLSDARELGFDAPLSTPTFTGADLDRAWKEALSPA